MHGDRFDHQCVPRYGLESDGTSFRIDKLQRNCDRLIGISSARRELQATERKQTATNDRGFAFWGFGSHDVTVEIDVISPQLTDPVI